MSTDRELLEKLYDVTSSIEPSGGTRPLAEDDLWRDLFAKVRDHLAAPPSSLPVSPEPRLCELCMVRNDEVKKLVRAKLRAEERIAKLEHEVDALDGMIRNRDQYIRDFQRQTFEAQLIAGSAIPGLESYVPGGQARAANFSAAQDNATIQQLEQKVSRWQKMIDWLKGGRQGL